MMFRSGQKVVCIKRDSWRRSDTGESGGAALPAFGDVYTIDRIDLYDGETFLYLREIAIPYASFISTAFRPVAERPTDISTLTALLTPSKVDA